MNAWRPAFSAKPKGAYECWLKIGDVKSIAWVSVARLFYRKRRLILHLLRRAGVDPYVLIAYIPNLKDASEDGGRYQEREGTRDVNFRQSRSYVKRYHRCRATE